ncbi:MAG: amino acid ABC transporter permease [Ruminococcus sp.]|nr:amino acid ABC transporter permease [Ruminococcus sp.]
MQEFFSGIGDSLYKLLIVENRWEMLLEGLGITLFIALISTILGTVLGFLVGIVRSTYDLQLKGKKCRKFSDYLLKVLDVVARIYVTVIRGTPVMVQIMIMFFVVFATAQDGVFPAILTFGINSGAYVAEIMRSGIMSIDKGQFEASRSIGFDYKRTMIYIILPQAIKNILPALGNEFIVLLKETSVACYVSVQELTFTGNMIASRTYDIFTSLIAVAAIYLVVVLVISYLLKLLERRLHNSDH